MKQAKQDRFATCFKACGTTPYEGEPPLLIGFRPLLCLIADRFADIFYFQ